MSWTKIGRIHYDAVMSVLKDRSATAKQIAAATNAPLTSVYLYLHQLKIDGVVVVCGKIANPLNGRIEVKVYGLKGRDTELVKRSKRNKTVTTRCKVGAPYYRGANWEARLDI